MLLAQFYMTGMHGVERDFQRALHHLEQAAGDGHAVAYANIGKVGSMSSLPCVVCVCGCVGASVCVCVCVCVC